MRAHDLTEGISNIVYHSTGLHNVVKILADNTFRLTPDIGTSSEASQRPSEEKLYYMSFSRSKTGSFHYPVSEYAVGQALIVLDGQRLMAAGYSGKPIEYWGFGDKDEMEDRIFSTKPTIPNANKYISEIHVYFKSNERDDKDRDSIFIRLLRKLYRQSAQLGIQIYIYDDVKHFNLLDKRHATQKVTDLKTDVPPIKAYTSSYRRRNPFGDLMELLALDSEDKLSKNAKDRLDKMAGWYKDDTIRTISADVHNSRTDDNRPKLDALIAEMKKLKIYNIPGLVDYIINKFADGDGK